MHCNCQSIVHRALVTYSNASTGEIKVKIPSVIGTSAEVSISYIGRSSTNGYWAVPDIGEQIIVSSDDSNLNNVFWLQVEPYNALGVSSETGEPMGFANRLDSVISFDNTTRTFTISPVDGSYDVWVRGTSYQITGDKQITLPDSNNGYFISFNTSGELSYRLNYFDMEFEAPVSYVYWSSPSSILFTDERHGITLDWATHEYLHRTQGAQYATGFGISNYTTGGTGSTVADMKVDIANGTFFDEDLEINISHFATPIPNTWQQRLQNGAYIPVFYYTPSGWTRATTTQYPVKYGSTYPQYNNGSSLIEMNVNRYANSWIVATNNLNEPIICIMGQAQHSNISDAQDELWSNLSLPQFPVQEMRPLWRITFQSINGSAIKSAIRSVTDIRTSVKSVAGGTSSVAVVPPQTIESVTTRALINTDAGKMLTSSSDCVLTINTSTFFNQGQRVDIVRLGGTLTVIGSGVTLLYTPANTLRAINSAASIVCLSSITNTYLLVGDLG